MGKHLTAAAGSQPEQAPASADGRVRFMAAVTQAVRARQLLRLVLSKPRVRVLAEGFETEGSVLKRIRIQPVRMKDGVKLGFDWQYDTRDQRSNLDEADALATVDRLLGEVMTVAVLETAERITELGFSKRGRPLIRSRRVSTAPALPADTTGSPSGRVPTGNQAGQTPDQGSMAARHPSAVIGASAGSDDPSSDAASSDDGEDWAIAGTHNRGRHYLIRIDRPYLVDLGVTRPGGQLVPAMARKWRQINKFVEILVSAWRHNPASSQLGGSGQPPLRIRDFGAGKGYLTFALHDHLTHGLGLNVETVGIERRTDLVALCNRIALRHGMTGLRFEQGDIAHTSPGDTDWMIALHACDTATDDALYQGVKQHAAMLVCSPCCHRELRPQLLSPGPLAPILRHGIHKGQAAEMLTDGLRALLLEGEGYDTQVFEFISLEHTSKNKMILASRAARPRPVEEVRAEVEALKRFHGIHTQRLDQLLTGHAPGGNRL
ncbi:MAG: SAM-dependent methyltransferase [Lautropia sp.]|nr:SAM-dependent methyltransferase [Lautropia sp.]